MTGGVHFKFLFFIYLFFLEGKGFTYFHVTRTLGRLTRRTSAKAMQFLFLDWLAQGLLVLSAVHLAHVENLDIITVNPSLCV